MARTGRPVGWVGKRGEMSWQERGRSEERGRRGEM
jgi:hypothetical protein